ncbi:PD-(D/E)XK nuclease superfamily protein [Pontibacter ummariensis]|uniref:PD-(D/E)XK nuclease superfamily protein n=1 Tax=Pontibacter ummariensis TaxID=1610492 RepID=A0A239FRK4_9BACT|nr:PD-(D/E)XK nuclease family protein [Pontibacter ummariensis]PRY11990.1 PD-(D/E)XK nuclease superfamily protein [Pontibacter ummariensis]SNS58484.1 PD-(D/E)XK nuclease superfamily protein [Pontibacter ummariensis]
MQTFLELAAKYIYEKYKENISDLCVVLPSRRASFFFKTALAQAAPDPIWSPEVYAMEDFIRSLSKTDVLEPINLQLELFDLMQEQDPKLDFDNFVTWAGTLLEDFSRIDQNLVDTGKLFEYLGEAKALERWDPKFLGKELSPTLWKYFSLWDNIEKTYHNLQKRLLANKQAYTGMAFRKVAQNIEKIAKTTECHQFIFIGLNSLTRSEEKIIRTLLKHDKAEVLFDSDDFYMEADTPNRAGTFLRKYKSNWNLPEWRWQQNLLLTDEKEINVIGVANASMQGKLAGQLLQEIRQQDKHAQTAIVLPDETLLLPVLHSIPEEIPTYNVTMGLSFRGTPLFNLIDLLFEVHLTGVTQLQTSGYKVYQYHHLSVTKLLTHPFIRRYELYLNEQPEQAKYHGIIQQVLDKMAQENKVLITAQELLDLSQHHPLFETLFRTWRDCDDIIVAMYELIELLRQVYTHGRNNIETEYLYIFYTLVKRLDTIFDCREHKISVRSFRKFLYELISQTRLPFSGEPISEVQIMGMLETRALDFENLIILSVNENVLPAPKRQESLMPYDVLREFGLPTYAETEGAMAYNFYRLLQRAKRINLLYVLPSDTYGSGEKSRFVLQLQNDLALRNPKIKFRDLTAAVEQQEMREYNEDILIQKTPETITQLRQELERGLYPSHLNMYINCSLQYYFTRIAKMQEVDEVEEQLGADQFGTIVHQVLEDFFRPFELSGKPIQPDDVEQMQEALAEKVKREFSKVTLGAKPERGMNYLLYKVAVEVLEKYLQKLKASDELPLYVLRLEETLATTLSVQVGDEVVNVRIAGKADRIDLTGHELRVIDYKTGKVEQHQLTVKAEDLELHFLSDPKYGKARQLWLYEYVLKRVLEESPETILRNAQHVSPLRIEAKSGILSFRNLDAGVLSADFSAVEARGGETPKGFMNASEEILADFVRRVLDPEEPIHKTRDLEVCQWCAYKGICAR